MTTQTKKTINNYLLILSIVMMILSFIIFVFSFNTETTILSSAVPLAGAPITQEQSEYMPEKYPPVVVENGPVIEPD